MNTYEKLKAIQALSVTAQLKIIDQCATLIEETNEYFMGTPYTHKRYEMIDQDSTIYFEVDEDQTSITIETGAYSLGSVIKRLNK